MTSLREWMATLIEGEWSLTVAPEIYWHDERREASPRGQPLIKVYPLPGTSKARGAGYTGRRVWHYLCIDLKTRDLDNGESYLAEVERILWAHRISPLAGITHIEWNSNSRNGPAGMYWWTIDVTLYEPNKTG